MDNNKSKKRNKNNNQRD